MLRGINLGKRTLVKADLLAAAQAAGFSEARTLLASGNLVFEAGDRPAETIERDLHQAVAQATGIQSKVFVRNHAELARVIAANPFPEVARDRPGQLLVTFHREPVPPAAVEQIAAAHEGPERLRAVGRELYVDFPLGQGASLLDRTMAKLKLLPPGTGRNWNTVGKLADML
ncbi:MAG: DUF1697 domain-containing protein [Sphingomonas sp.]